MTYYVTTTPNQGIIISRLTGRGITVQYLTHNVEEKIKEGLEWSSDYNLDKGHLKQSEKAENLSELVRLLRVIKNPSESYFGMQAMSDEEFINEVIRASL